MNGKLYRVADGDALERLRAAGARILHRFPGGVVLSEPLAGAIAGVAPVETAAQVKIPASVRAAEIGELAFALRKTDAYRARKAQRRHVGADMDEIISGKAGKEA